MADDADNNLKHREISMKFGAAICFSISVSLVFLGTKAFAGGIMLYETGTPEVGLAAAGWAARAQDASTVLTNPAGMTRLAGDELLVGTQLLYADIGFETGFATFGGDDGGNPVGFFPGLSTYYSHSVSDRLKMGAALYGNFGLALDYNDGWAGRYHFQEGTLLGITLAPTVAYKATEALSVGGAVNMMFGIFSNTVAVNNIDPGLADGELELSDNQWGFGANLGLMYEVGDATRLGIQYTSEIELDFADTVEFSGLGPGLTAALIATGRLDTRIALDITVPQTVMVSLFHQTTPSLAVLANVGWQDWSEYGRVGVEVSSQSDRSLTLERDYDDSYHAAIGLQYDLRGPWLMSCGVAFDSGIVDDDTRTADLPNGDSWRFSLGGRYSVSESMDIGLGYTLLLMGDLDMNLDGGPLSGDTSGSFEDTSMHFFAVSFRKAF